MKNRFKKLRLKDFPIEIQEHYFNLKYQYSEFQAYNYLIINSIAPILLSLAISQYALQVVGSSLKKSGLLK